MIVVYVESRIRVKANKMSGITGCNRERAAGRGRPENGQQYHRLGVAKGPFWGLASCAWGSRPRRPVLAFTSAKACACMGQRSWPHQPVETVNPISPTTRRTKSTPLGPLLLPQCLAKLFGCARLDTAAQIVHSTVRAQHKPTQ
ncbi:hypothetical protein B0H65DRAFT_103175 [Neurospora tetraspora]|uniref:Uncharacterized protein n=1 Tax=Neurospora tetraspora TaxID=94610 RepID=A0AAE0MTV2_9PEZI|nr:hypothetical protein B0H65DRAFT_103175 [Neurospora tetraspora]